MSIVLCSCITVVWSRGNSSIPRIFVEVLELNTCSIRYEIFCGYVILCQPFVNIFGIYVFIVRYFVYCTNTLIYLRFTYVLFPGCLLFLTFLSNPRSQSQDDAINIPGNYEG